MTWIAAILLALAGFALAVVLFKLPRGLWTSFMAALALGLAGYALQASPNLPSAPKDRQVDQQDQVIDIVSDRLELVEPAARSGAELMITADAMARRQRYADAAQILAGITQQNTQDFEAWLALGNALVEHADGMLTPPSLYAYRRAAMLRPDHLAPNYFLGVSLIRQGRMMEARQVWSDAVANAPEDAAGRETMVLRLSRLEEILGLAAQEPAPAQAVQ